MPDGETFLSFEGSLIDMNLGDAGALYVFSRGAFWQCR